MITSLTKNLQLLLIAVGLFSIATSGAYAKKKKTRLRPTVVKQIKKSNKSFINCKKQATEDYKDEFLNKKQYKLALTTCKERYPGANLYISCKASAIKKFKKIPAKRAKAIKSCKKFQIATTFDQKRHVPFFSFRKSLYFAGIGMNKSIAAAELAPPNFDCSKLKSTFKDLSKAQHLPFGNSPKVFRGMEKISKKKLRRAFKKTGLAHIIDDLAYFPVTSCDFIGKRGKNFDALSAYYIINPTSKTAIPYFAVAHYNKTRKLTPKTLVSKFHKIFGTQYKPNVFEKIPHVIYLSTKPMNTSLVDQDGEPKNLCQKPRSHHFLAVVSGHKESPDLANYILVANVATMCAYGDTVSKRLNKKL